MYFTRQCFAREIIEAETFSVSAVALRAFSIKNCMLVSGTCSL